MAITTEFRRIASSGNTIDGRELKPEDLKDMADTYDPNVYQAKLWFQHIRWFGAMGDVLSLKAVDVEDESKPRVDLYAQIKPNENGLRAIRNDHVNHGSVELAPNFADTGKCYLRGLGLTDQPASLRTEQFNFSESNGVMYSEPVEIDWAFSELQLEDIEPKVDDTLLNKFKRFLLNDEPEAGMPEKDKQPPGITPDIQERFSSIESKLEQLLGSPKEKEKGSELEERFSSIENKLEKLLGSSEEKEKGNEFEERFSSIENKLEKLLEEAPGKDNPKDEEFKVKGEGTTEEVFV